jgi:hypothetical protein
VGAAIAKEKGVLVDSLQKREDRDAQGRFLKGRSGNPEGRFRKGRSGNPKGRPAGARNKATQTAELLLQLALPPVSGAADLGGTMAAITNAAASGAITPGEAAELARVVEIFVRAVETSDFERRLKELEEAHAARR